MRHQIVINSLIHGTAFGTINGKPFVAEMEVDPKTFTGDWRVEATKNQQLDFGERRTIPEAVKAYAQIARHTVPSPN